MNPFMISNPSLVADRISTFTYRGQEEEALDSNADGVVDAVMVYPVTTRKSDLNPRKGTSLNPPGRNAQRCVVDRRSAWLNTRYLVPFKTSSTGPWLSQWSPCGWCR